MKKVLIIFALFALVPFAQESASNEKVNSAIDNLFSASKNKDYNNVSLAMVYTGTDEERSYKSTLDPKSDNELAKAERIAKKIKAYLDISDSYNVNSVVTEKDNGKSFIKAEVSFKSGSQVLEISFNFLDVNDKLLLVSID